MEKYAYKDFSLGRSFDLGTITLSEEAIIDYARRNDPMEFHINKDAAMKSIFKGLVSSASQILNSVHIKSWFPMFNESVICGLEINNWKFLKPVYANQPIHCKCTIAFLKPNEEKKHCVVTWHYEFKDNKEELVQTLDITVLHRINSSLAV